MQIFPGNVIKVQPMTIFMDKSIKAVYLRFEKDLNYKIHSHQVCALQHITFLISWDNIFNVGLVDGFNLRFQEIWGYWGQYFRQRMFVLIIPGTAHQTLNLT